jgi:uncharacterized protein
MEHEIRLDRDAVDAAILGGTVLGGGGGGSIDEGRKIGYLAVTQGKPRLVDIQSIPKDTILITCAAVGAPSAKEAYTDPRDYLRTIEMVSQLAGVKIGGVITNECGGTATVNGWYQSSRLGIPVVDAPCNGRAHPNGMMGSMGMHKIPGFVSVQAAAGGSPTIGRHIEAAFSGGLESVAALVRQTSVHAAGMVVVARNPVEAQYVQENGAPGAVQRCINVGKAMIAARAHGNGLAVIEAAAKELKGEIIVQGVVDDLELNCAGGFDVGRFFVNGFEMTYWNEYITLEKGKQRLATFPDLMMTFDVDTGNPVTSANLREGQKVAILVTSRRNLILGAGMRDPQLLAAAEKIIGKSIVPFIFPTEAR